MSINVPGPSVIQPMQYHKGPVTKQPFETPISSTINRNIEKESVEAQKKLNKGIVLLTGSGIVASSGILMQAIATKALPALEKSLAVHFGTGVAGLAGMFYAAKKIIIPASKQLAAIEQRTLGQNGSVSS